MSKRKPDLGQKIHQMETLRLPKLTGERQVPHLPGSAKQLTIIGGSSAGKTKFMEELVRLNSRRAYYLSAVSAPYPEREESKRPGSIDMQYRSGVERRPYMRTDALSELDKLVYMLFADEFEYLMQLKDDWYAGKRNGRPTPTKLDRLASIWEKVFPGNRIIRAKGYLMFATNAGDDLIPVDRLSQSEKTVLYYAAGVLYAMPDAVIVVDSPSLFLHPTVLNNLWNSIEELRPDCTFVYNSVDVEFVSSRTRNVSVWVKSYDASQRSWDYEIIAPGELHEDIFIDLIGSRRPVLFIEGDISHSIDARLYPLVFPDYTVKPLGSCDKVIETTRTFNDLKNMHHLESHGIVDRDRRTDQEVEYLRKKSIMVPDVAEVENLFLLEGVVRGMAIRRGKDPDIVFNKVRRHVESDFKRHYDAQALQHVRHRVKREVECRIDAKFACITAMETHLRGLINILKPRERYNEVREYFLHILKTHDYNAILKVFNHKPMLGDCGVAELLKYKNKDEYIAGVIATLKERTELSSMMRETIRNCFRIDGNEGETIHTKGKKRIPDGYSIRDYEAYHNPKSHNHRSKRKNKKKSHIT